MEKRIAALERLVAPKLLANTALLSERHPMRRAAYVVGSQSELARRLAVTKSMVSQLCSDALRVPAELAIAIERETAGAVTVEELRPDIDWAVIRGRPAPVTREAA